MNIAFLLKRVDCNDGVASYCDLLINGLRDLGHRSFIVSGPVSGAATSTQRYQSLSLAAEQWLVLEAFDPIRPRPAEARKILGFIREHAVDVLHTQGLLLLPLTWFLSKVARRPAVVSYHPSVHGNDAGALAIRRSRSSQLLHRLLLRAFAPQRLIALSSEISEFYEVDCRVAPPRVARMLCGVDTGIYRPPTGSERQRARAALGIGPNRLVCVLPGRLNLNKGHDVVVDAMRILRRRILASDVICLFPGTGSQQDEIERHALVDAADREQFRFLGYVEDIRESYWASDIVLLPSRVEGFGIVVAEAMCCGCIPIRTPSGGVRDQILHGDNGYIVPFNDPAALAGRIVELHDSGRRSLLRARVLSHAASQFAKEHMIAATMAAYDAAIREVGIR